MNPILRPRSCAKPDVKSKPEKMFRIIAVISATIAEETALLEEQGWERSAEVIEINEGDVRGNSGAAEWEEWIVAAGPVDVDLPNARGHGHHVVQSMQRKPKCGCGFGDHTRDSPRALDREKMMDKLRIGVVGDVHLQSVRQRCCQS